MLMDECLCEEKGYVCSSCDRFMEEEHEADSEDLFCKSLERGLYCKSLEKDINEASISKP